MTKKKTTYEVTWEGFRQEHVALMKMDTGFRKLHEGLEEQIKALNNNKETKQNLLDTLSSLVSLRDHHKELLHELGNTLTKLSPGGLKILVRKEIDKESD